MRNKLISLKKALFGGMAFVAAELREMNLKVTNRTTGRPGAMTVKEPVVSTARRSPTRQCWARSISP